MSHAHYVYNNQANKGNLSTSKLPTNPTTTGYGLSGASNKSIPRNDVSLGPWRDKPPRGQNAKRRKETRRKTRNMRSITAAGSARPRINEERKNTNNRWRSRLSSQKHYIGEKKKNRTKRKPNGASFWDRADYPRLSTPEADSCSPRNQKEAKTETNTSH